jgi:tungstate transport system substrate-binding protein
MEVWEKAGIHPDSAKDTWYDTFARGDTGNGPTNLYADGRGAYILMDRATYLIQKDSIRIVPLVEKDTLLLNFMAAIAVNPAKFPNINAKGAKAFTDWLCGYEAQAIIGDFETHKYNEPLFFPNSNEWKRQREKTNHA